MSRAGTVLDHLLHVCATRHLSLDSTRIPRGVAVPVHGTPFDFTSARRIGARIDEPHEQLRIGPRYDHTWVLDKAADAMSFAAELSSAGAVVWRGWAQATALRVDVSETEKEYRVLAEMPGVRKEDINVSINGNEIAISAEVKNEKEAKEGGQALRTERFYGKLHRALVLEHPIDEAKAQARYTDGVLELTLPKSEAAMPKRISVH